MSRQTSTSSPYKLGTILERMLSVDKDLRYMAVSDLMNETEKGEIVLDDDGEKKTCRHLLKLLEDKSSEVQNIVIRAIGHLTTRIKNKDCLIFLATSLSDMINTKSGEIYCTALKTVVNQLSPAKGGENTTNAVKELYPKLVLLLENTDESMASELVDIISELLLRYGTKLSAYHGKTLDVINKWILTGRSMSRKRATMALGSLTACCDNELFKEAVENIFKWLNSKPKDQLMLRNYVMAANYVCRSRGSQFSLYLSEILPKLKVICNDTEDEDNREAVLTTLETFLYFCAGNIAQYQSEIRKILLQYLSHDPNYCIGDEDEEMDTQDADWEDDEDNQYSDTDDDLSWKVRRACAKALATEVKYLDNTGAKLLNWQTVVAPKLVERMKDREDHVLLEIVHALKEMTVQVNKFLPERGSQNIDSFGDVAGMTEASEEQIAARQELEKLLPKLIGGLSKMIEKKTTITRSVSFELLMELTKALPNQFTGDFFVNCVKAGLDDKNGGSQIKMLVLQFITATLKTHEPTAFFHHVPQLTEILVKAVDDNFYKIVSEAIHVLSRYAVVLEAAKNADPNSAAPHIDTVYTLLEQLLQKNHGDNEILHAAISATGNYLGRLANLTNPKEERLLTLLTEIAERPAIDQNTTISALQALKAVAGNSNARDLFATQVDGVIGNLANLIEKNSGGGTTRTRDSVVDLQNTILELAVTIFNNQHAYNKAGGITRLVAGLPTLLNDSDLLVAHKALQCMEGALQIGLYDPSFLPSLVKLLESHLLCGSTLRLAIQTSTSLAKELMKNGKKYESLLDDLTSPVYDKPNLPRQAYKSIAMATADIAAALGDKESALQLVNQLIGHLKSANNNERLFSILTIGELGHTFPEVYNGVEINPEKLLSSILSSQNDELRIVAAQALGALAAGNPTRYLPFIIKELSGSTTSQLPLLHAIKEVLSSRKLEDEDVTKIWPVLVGYASSTEESIRTITADCIGKLCDDTPAEGLQALQKLVGDSDVNTRYTAVSAFKTIVFDGNNIQNKMLAPYLKTIGDAISDSDIRVRRIGLIVLNALLYKRTQLMRSYVREILPAVFAESKIRKELIREVEMGPFKHQVDDGIDLRKAAYECMFTIAERCTSEINMEEFILNLDNGLKDSNHEIKLLTMLVLSRLCVLAPTSLLQGIPRFTEQLKTMLTTKPKPNAVRQEIEKIDEMKKAVIRVIRSMQKITDSERQLVEITAFLNFNSDLKTLIEAVDTERDSASV